MTLDTDRKALEAREATVKSAEVRLRESEAAAAATVGEVDRIRASLEHQERMLSQRQQVVICSSLMSELNAVCLLASLHTCIHLPRPRYSYTILQFQVCPSPRVALSRTSCRPSLRLQCDVVAILKPCLLVDASGQDAVHELTEARTKLQHDQLGEQQRLTEQRRLHDEERVRLERAREAFDAKCAADTSALTALRNDVAAQQRSLSSAQQARTLYPPLI